MNLDQTFVKAVRVIWRHKLLWFLGFLTSLGADYSVPSMQFGPVFGTDQFPMATNLGETPAWIVPAIGIGLVLLLVIGVFFLVIGLIARGSLIAGVQQVEVEGNTSLAKAVNVGVGRFWRMLGMRVLLYLPIVVVASLSVFLGLGVLATSASATLAPSAGQQALGRLGSALAILGPIVAVLGCATALYGLVAAGLEVLGERAIVIDALPVMDSLSKAWALFKAHLGHVLLVAVLLFAIDFVYSLLAMLGIGVIMAPLIAIAVASFESQRTALGVVLASGALGILIIGLILVGSLFTTYVSTVWTLAYRQFETLQKPAAAAPTIPHAPMPA